MNSNLASYTSNRDNNFNLIRFIAAVLVLYSHSFVLANGTGDIDPLKAYIGVTWGNIAVDIFFITSGFLIAGSFFSRNNIVAFVWARFLRIYPALIVAMMFCVLVVGLFFTSLPLSEYLSSDVTLGYFFKNIVLFFGVNYRLPGVFVDLPYQYAVNGSLWTLHYEVKMYVCLMLIFTALFYLNRAFNENVLKFSILIMAIAAIVLNVVNYYQEFISPNFLHLFSMFFVGAAYYIWREYIYLSLNIFVIIVIIFFVVILQFKEIFYLVYCLLLPYLVFYLAYVPSGKVRKFNNVGDYSYGIYIYAFPVQQSISATIPGVSVGIMIVLSFVLTFVFAYFSWHFIEKKAMRYKGRYVMFDSFIAKTKLSFGYTK